MDEPDTVADQATVETTFGRRSGAVSIDWLRTAALAGLCLDAVTTWVVLTTAGYRELNPVIDGLWGGHPSFVAAYFSGLVLAVAATTHRRGRAAAAISAYVAVVMGVFGGGNNLALFVIGPPSLLEVLAGVVGVSGPTVVAAIAPACGLLAAAGVVCLHHGAGS